MDSVPLGENVQLDPLATFADNATHPLLVVTDFWDTENFLMVGFAEALAPAMDGFTAPVTAVATATAIRIRPSRPDICTLTDVVLRAAPAAKR
jgi:hypothetical protein